MPAYSELKEQPGNGVLKGGFQINHSCMFHREDLKRLICRRGMGFKMK